MLLKRKSNMAADHALRLATQIEAYEYLLNALPEFDPIDDSDYEEYIEGLLE